MRKKQLAKNIRIYLIVTAVLLVGIMAVLIYFKALRPVFQEKKITLYNYTTQLTSNYQVTLKPNALYDKPQGENSIYLTSLVDKITTNFNYVFQGEHQADIKGNFDIVAVVEGFTNENNQANTIWQKHFQLVQSTNFEAQDQKIAIAKEVPINLKEFNDFVNKVANESGVHSESKLTVYMNVNLNANTDKGPVTEKTTSSISLPLNSNYFKIVKTEVSNKPGAIVQIEKARVPINTNLVAVYAIILGICLIALIVLVIFTSAAAEDQHREFIRKIFNKHGSRLVSLNEALRDVHQFKSEVRTFEDLVRVSDEVAKPIVYQHSEDLHKIASFYVVDDNCMYEFNLPEIISTLKDNVIEEEANAQQVHDSISRLWSNVVRPNTIDEIKTKEG